MNQPRFKFGDKVAHGDTVFKIDKIEWVRCDSGTEYLLHGFILKGSGYDRCSFPESNLQLCQEPQKKKLYAYTRPGTDEIKLSTKEINDRLCSQFWDRAPEYDIEYPEAK